MVITYVRHASGNRKSSSCRAGPVSVSPLWVCLGGGVPWLVVVAAVDAVAMVVPPVMDASLSL